jgi:hypothetical protein
MIMLGDEVAISFDGMRILCRPTLRAATNLNRQFGLTQLTRDVVTGNLTAVRRVISMTADDLDILGFIDVAPMQQVMSLCQPAAYALLLAMTAVDEPSNADASEGEPMSFADFLEQLFSIGTGWLGWTPETTWEATPAEILAAYRGLIAKLEAIHGVPDDKAKPKKRDSRPLDRQFEDVFAGCKVVHIDKKAA